MSLHLNSSRLRPKNPQAGTPFAVTGLDAQEYDTCSAGWSPAPRWMSSHARPTPARRRRISQWEAPFNGDSPREVLVARWLYEHLFLATFVFRSGRKVASSSSWCVHARPLASRSIR